MNRESTAVVDYRQEYAHIGPADNPIFTTNTPERQVYIHYSAPVLDFSGAPIITNDQYGGRYYLPAVWNGLNELDLYARLVSAERGSNIGSGPFDRERVLEGLAVAYTVHNRTQDTSSPDQFAKFGSYRGQVLAEGQFAFTLVHAVGGNSVKGAEQWADIADNDPLRDREIYEHSLRYVVGISQGWFNDPSHGALFFVGDR